MKPAIRREAERAGELEQRVADKVAAIAAQEELAAAMARGRMASRRVIVLEQLDGAARRFRFAMWADVAPARQAFYANATATSAFKGVTAQELQDLRDGKVIEAVEVISFQEDKTLAQLRTELQARWTRYQAEVAAETTFTRYGTSWAGDGSSWTAAGA
jgi:hypothetical protein